MRRRRLLELAPAALLGSAGCTGRMGSANQNTSSEGQRYEASVPDADRENAGLLLAVNVLQSTIKPNNPALLEFALTNVAEERKSITTGVLWPFGVVYAVESEGDREFLLWSDQYEESDNVKIVNGTVSATAVGVQRSIRPNKTVTQSFSIPHNTDSLSPSRYRITNQSGERFNVGEVQFDITLHISRV